MKAYELLNVSNNIKTYDVSSHSTFTLYDNMPYVSDPAICNRSNVTLRSDNFIKFYRCTIKEKRVISYDTTEDFDQI